VYKRQIVDGAGGINSPIPGDLPATETSSGNIRMDNGVGHDPMLSDLDTMRLVKIILDMDIGSIPSIPSNPSTVNKESDVLIEIDLDWDDSLGSDTYDFNFGITSPPFRITFQSYSNNPGKLEYKQRRK